MSDRVSQSPFFLTLTILKKVRSSLTFLPNPGTSSNDSYLVEGHEFLVKNLSGFNARTIWQCSLRRELLVISSRKLLLNRTYSGYLRNVSEYQSRKIGWPDRLKAPLISLGWLNLLK